MSTNIFFLLTLTTFLCLLSFVLQRHHILMCLLSLEATILSLAFLVTLSTSSLVFSNLFYCIVILCFGACEAAVALGVLVLVSRSFGSDSLNAVNTNKC